MRILLVSDSYPPLIGGATRSAQILAHELAGRGHEICVATSWQEGAPTHEYEPGGVEVRRLHGLTMRLPWLSANKYRRIPPPFPDPETTVRLRRLIRRFRPDLVHVYGWMAYSVALALLGSRIPVLVSARDYGNICAVRSLVRDGEICSGPALGKCLGCASRHYGAPKGTLCVVGVLGCRRLLGRHVGGLHSVSTYVREQTTRYLLPWVRRRRVGSVVPNVVIPDFRAPGITPASDDPMLHELPDEPFILFVGALRRIKGIHELLQAYACLVDPPPLVLMGPNAPDTPQGFPEGVTVLNDVPHAAVMAAWDRALFGVAPSICPEPLGNVVHEAMSRGRPMIGTIPGGHADMIKDGINGRLIRAGDVDALEAAMRDLIADRQGRERMGQTASLAGGLFTAEVAVPAFEDLYRSMVETSPA
jgi:glycosyltransferase involved in cell wall biosynthesis